MTTEPLHGKASGYRNGGCRCAPCCKAGRRASKQYHVRRLAMGGSTTVDSTRAAETIRDARQHMSYSAMALAIGSSHSYITAIAKGKVKRISPERETAILGLARHRPDGTSHVSPIGARRRIQALYALGYSFPRLVAETGYTLQSIKRLAHNPWPVIEARNDRAIRDAYDRLCMTLPTSDNLQERSGIARARNTARRHGWVPPLAWDDIDDPDATPTGTNSGHTTDVNATRAYELEHLAFMGDNLEGACRALGITDDALWAWCRRNGHQDLYERLARRSRRHENQYTNKGAA